jgi:toxin-antitoxin system PIN domain toxin
VNAPASIDPVEPALLDVNVLIALCDPGHEHHDAAQGWFEGRHRQGWATCAITENGFVRIVSHPAYPNRVTSPEAAREFLRQFVNVAGHEFLSERVTLRDRNLFPDLSSLSPGAVTDTYLLGLAALHGAKFATFDRTVATRGVKGGDGLVELITGSRKKAK